MALAPWPVSSRQATEAVQGRGLFGLEEGWRLGPPVGWVRIRAPLFSVVNLSKKKPSPKNRNGQRAPIAGGPIGGVGGFHVLRQGRLRGAGLGK